MIGILDVLAAIVASAVTGNDGLVATDDQPVWIGLYGHSGARMLGRHRVAVGIEANAELARGAQGEDARHIIRMRS